jgi:hypothetical protein
MTVFWDFICPLLATSLVLGVLAACIERLPFRRWVRICACGHPHDVHEHHRPESDCSLRGCPCGRWRPLRVRRRQPPGGAPPLPQRHLVPYKTAEQAAFFAEMEALVAAPGAQEPQPRKGRP